MKSEFWEITHKVAGVEMRIYDLIVVCLVTFMAIVASCMYLLGCGKEQNRLDGEIQITGFTAFTDPANAKLYKIGGLKAVGNKKSVNNSGKKPKEDVFCAACGASLIAAN